MRRIVTAAGLATLAATASAQSSLTLYGVVDLGVRYVKNGDASVTSLASGGNNTSRFGLRGSEDLGDGLRAGFQLESGINADSGTPQDATRFWNRRSTVSLLGSLGELRLGRDYTVTYLGYEEYDVWSDVGITAVGKFDSSLGTARDTAIRSDNQIVYFTPALGGVYGRLAFAPGEGVVGKKHAAGRVGYAAGPLDVSLSIGQTMVAPVGGDDRFKTADLGAAYDFGPFKLSGYLTHSTFAGMKATNAYIGGQVPLGLGLVRASYLRSNLSGRNAAGLSIDADDAQQVALGYLFNLSPRTAIYSNVSHVINEGASAVAIDRNPTLLPGRNSTGFDVGVRHSF
ncbi:MAG TPA: porin [Burkholderiaceae bacterium]|nr:porin [Burkholderiaceae bacterium]